MLARGLSLARMSASMPLPPPPKLRRHLPSWQVRKEGRLNWPSTNTQVFDSIVHSSATAAGMGSGSASQAVRNTAVNPSKLSKIKIGFMVYSPVFECEQVRRTWEVRRT